MTRICLLVTAQEDRAARWARQLRSGGWRVERRAQLPAAAPEAAEALVRVALIDLGLTLPKPAVALSRLQRACPGWRLCLVADDSDAFGPYLVEAMESGADEVIQASLEGVGLLTRVDGLTKPRPAVLETADGRIRLDWSRRQAWVQLARPRLLRLTRTEFELLAMLLERRGTVVARRELIERVWPEEDVNGETVDRHIGALRRKLASVSGSIRTAHGVGYAAD